jgi:cytochrome c oxidase cbb3-type subunit IV
MVKEVLSDIEGIGIFPTISFLMFFIFFGIILLWLLRTKKNDFEEISRSPLHDNYMTKQTD